ncbi:MAG TPA: cupin domain-containing protein [Hanamia sp.]
MNKPEIKLLNKGNALKILEVTGNANVLMPKHTSSEEATIIVLKGGAIIDFGGSEHLLKTGDSLLIPAKQVHSLLVMTKLKALVVMPSESLIEFTN